MQSQGLVEPVQNWLEEEVKMLPDQKIGAHKVFALIRKEDDDKDIKSALEGAVLWIASNIRPQPQFKVCHPNIIDYVEGSYIGILYCFASQLLQILLDLQKNATLKCHEYNLHLMAFFNKLLGRQEIPYAIFGANITDLQLVSFDKTTLKF